MAKTREHKSSKPLARGNTERKSHPMVPRAGLNRGRTYPYGQIKLKVPMIDKTISLTMQDINKFRQMLTM